MRAIALIVLVPFVMTCTGCSSRYAADPAIDPVADDEPLEIVAYVLADGSRVQWHGTIYGVSSDSLEFRRHEDKTKPKQGLFDQTDGDPAPKRSVFRLPRTEVTSVEVLDRHEVRTLAMVVPIVVVFVFLMLVIGSGIYSGPLLSESS